MEDPALRLRRISAQPKDRRSGRCGNPFQRALESFARAGDRATFPWDGDLNGGGARVTKAFISQYRNARGKSRCLTIGRFDVKTVENTRGADSKQRTCPSYLLPKGNLKSVLWRDRSRFYGTTSQLFVLCKVRWISTVSSGSRYPPSSGTETPSLGAVGAWSQKSLMTKRFCPFQSR